MRLDVGCGAFVQGGYAGLDIIDYGQEYVLDVRDGLPCDDDSVDAIRAAHFIEHLTSDEAIAFLNECWRVLKPGGEMVISTPNAMQSACAYVLEHRSLYAECTFTNLENVNGWDVYGIRPWRVKKIVTNNRNDIHCWMEPVK